VYVGLATPLRRARFAAAGATGCESPLDDRDARAAPPVPATHDVVPGVYEGGAKLWEGGVDLARLLATAAGGGGHPDAPTPAADAPPLPPLPGACVLELGCGAGLPGVVALLAGAARVTFADYNEGVLRVTAATVAAAWGGAGGRRPPSSSSSSPPPAAYYAGDWSDLPSALAADAGGGGGGGGGFDVVVGAELAYDPTALPSLAAALAALLAPPSPPAAVGLIAGKRYYFGVGGGTVALVAACEGAGLAATVVATADGGSAVPRDVVRVVRRSVE
jgi:SAM-dependent methyltransferase